MSWRKSEAIELDEFVSLAKIESEHPTCVEITKTPNKTELKKLIKQGIEIDGVELKSKLNIQIK